MSISNVIRKIRPEDEEITPENHGMGRPIPVDLDAEIGQLAARIKPEPLAPLTPEASELICRAMIQAADAAAKHCTDASDARLREAQEDNARAHAWAGTLRDETKRMAETMAAGHAKMRAFVKAVADADATYQGKPQPPEGE